MPSDFNFENQEQLVEDIAVDKESWKKWGRASKCREDGWGCSRRRKYYEPKYGGGQLKSTDEEWTVSHDLKVCLREWKIPLES